MPVALHPDKRIEQHAEESRQAPGEEADECIRSGDPSQLQRHQRDGELLHQLQAEITEQHPEHDLEKREARVGECPDAVNNFARHMTQPWGTFTTSC